MRVWNIVTRLAVVSQILFSFIVSIGAAECKPTEPTYKVAFIMSGPISDFGYNYAHNAARIYLQSHLANIETTMAENVKESAEAERVMEKLVAQGNRLLFSTSFGYLEAAERVARRHPNVLVMQGWRPSSLKNVGSYAVYMYEPLYVAGMVAGKMTRTNKLGIICSHPIPATLQNVNAVALGARSVNPKARVHVVWTNSWSDPPTEAEATKALIESGVDVVGSELSGPLTVAKTAEQRGVMTIGNQSDMQSVAPGGWLTGGNWNLGPTFCRIVKSAQDGTWRPGLNWFAMRDGTIEMSSFGKRVPKAVKCQALAIAESLRQGKLKVFSGPLKDREGKLRLASGQAESANFLSTMDWFVAGVDGSLPKH